jgi:hypothetical protein
LAANLLKNGGKDLRQGKEILNNPPLARKARPRKAANVCDKVGIGRGRGCLAKDPGQQILIVFPQQFIVYDQIILGHSGEALIGIGA